MIGPSVLFTWLPTVGQTVSRAAETHQWIGLLSYVAAVVFVFIILIGVYLILLALKQRKQEDLV